MSSLEIVATLFGIVAVWLTVVRNPLCWPMGLVQVVLSLAVFWEARLYADLALHVVYVFLQFYGWTMWMASKRTEAQTERDLKVESLQGSGWLIVFVTCSVLWLSISAVLIAFTNADKPVVDAFIAAASLVAQVLLASRKIENWPLWIAVDLVAIALFLQKELYAFTILYVLFLGMAIWGWVEWHRVALVQQSDNRLQEVSA